MVAKTLKREDKVEKGPSDNFNDNLHDTSK
jgi:hypothetical protein